MGSNVNFSGPLGNSQGFLSPQALIAPDQAVEQQQVQRQNELAAALRQMSFEPIDASNGGNIAWTQGMAKLAQAIAGGFVQRSADKRQKSLNQVMSAQMNGDPKTGKLGMFGGIVGGGGQASGGGGQAPPPASIAPPAPVMNVPDAPSAAPSGVPQAPSPTMPQPGQADQLAPMPQQMPPQQAPQQGVYQRGQWSISDNPRADMQELFTAPDKYWDARNAQNAMTDAAKNLVAQGLQPGSPEFQAQMAKINFKGQFIEPSQGRPGGYTNYADGRRVYNPKLEDGATPLYDDQGNIVAQTLLGGTIQAIAQGESARAGAKAGFTPQQILGADNKYHTVPLTNVPGFGNAPPPDAPPPGAPPPTAGSPKPTGTIGNYYANQGGGNPPANTGNISGLGPRGNAAEIATGTASAAAYDAAMKEAAGARNTQMLTNRMLDEIDGMGKGDQLPTGAGAAEISHLKSGWNSAVGAFGGPDAVQFSPDKIARFDELKKNTAQLGMQMAGQASGKNGTTDARLTTALAGIPGAGYNPTANAEVRTVINGLAEGVFQHAQAKALDAKNNGTGGNIEFERQWQQAYNPDLFYHMQKGDLSAWEKSMSPTAQARVKQQALKMRALGAFQ